MTKFYFDLIDKILGFKTPKIKLFFALLYFPILITIFLLSFNYTENHWSLLNYAIISGFILGFPALAIPAIHFLNKRNFLLFRKITEIIDDCKIDAGYNTQIFNERNQIHISSPKDIIKSIYVLFVSDKEKNKNVSYEAIYKPGKKITTPIKLKLQDFYKNSAKEYFEVFDYDLDLFIDILCTETIVTKDTAIELYEGLQSHNISALISQLNKITGIDKKQLALLFKKFNKKSGTVELINWNSIKSSESQRNRISKS